jgi:SAM-dependent methyltransferase
MMGLAEREARCRILLRKHYKDVPSREWFIDQAVASVLRSTDTLLDAGSGSTLALLNRYAPKASFGVGIDVVPPSEPPVANATVAIGDLSSLPFEDRSFDVIVSRSVVEHLENPLAVFRELRRVLRPGGRLIFTTPNKFYYGSIVAALVPYSWKDFYMRKMFGDQGYDHFPVFYRANTKRRLRKIAAQSGLQIDRLEALRHFPFYLLFSPMLFRLGILYDWLVTRFRVDGLNSTWLVIMRRA